MGNFSAHKHVRSEKDTYDSDIVYILLKKFPVIKAVYNAIDDWRSSGVKPEVVVMDNSPSIDSEYKSILNQFLSKVASDVTVSGAKLIIFYHPTTEIDELYIAFFAKITVEPIVRGKEFFPQKYYGFYSQKKAIFLRFTEFCKRSKKTKLGKGKRYFVYI